MSTLRVGDRCIDENRNWPNYGKEGTVVSFNGNNVTWKPDGGGKLITDPINDMRKIMKRKGGRRRLQQGGLLKGKSHKYGGIPAIIDGKEPVELEGGEYVIRESSVQKYGEGTIARINQGLVDPNKLRRLKNGGPVNGRNNMVRRRKPGYRKGGKVANKRRFQQGGHTHIEPGMPGAPLHKHNMYAHLSGVHGMSADEFYSLPDDQRYGQNPLGAHVNNWYGQNPVSTFNGNMGVHGHGSSTINPNPRGGGRTQPTLNRSGGRIRKGRKMQNGGPTSKRVNNNKKYRGLNIHLQSKIRESKNAVQTLDPGPNTPNTGTQATTGAHMYKQGGRVTGKR